MDFYLASDSSPTIHSKAIAKVQKRIGIYKKVVDDLLLKQIRMGSCIKQT